MSDEDKDETEDNAGEAAVTVQSGSTVVENKAKLIKPTVLTRPVGQPNVTNTPHTKKGEYIPPTPTVISPKQQQQPIVPATKSRPRVVSQ